MAAITAATFTVPGGDTLLDCNKCKILGPNAAIKMGCFKEADKAIVDLGTMKLFRCPWAILREAGVCSSLNYIFDVYDLRTAEPFSTQKAILVDAWSYIGRVNAAVISSSSNKNKKEIEWHSLSPLQ